ncbi:Heat shock factor protein 1 [Bienertia sinuspersici]
MYSVRDMNCGCGIPVARRTSWTHENPGRKFVACKFYNAETGQRGCNKFEWLDEDIVDWQRDVTNVLIDEKHRLATDNSILKSRIVFAEHENKRLVEEVEKLKQKKKRQQPTDVVLNKDKPGVSIIVVSVIVSVIISLLFIKIFV